ncbi:acetyl-CoA carboxylase biotin carboxyl carrier protein [Phocicoccus pinnipedialis]|uniref:Biotin carboxyl carrier protein of acetyl-CoA carboxylase n=1 Tax=Phocicoccus pinnipedialis TaxID=110845 RepID=A0A6V7RDP0_9BACL|nr:acetyl-CoA carboxylase biotin carboxyl carrier protein [Jeotgalicoccus pinnipedialis]MBP1939317.1 acetyl-CoA carboxylase biotin carboxyl carrier protein [Jeotgalicoccus pinnipedialis]CAD2075905.1 Biotin carboxyl carrier protein of acetyl-CoA carboxylase [Jeotgalicoccus pinnipedialis]
MNLDYIDQLLDKMEKAQLTELSYKDSEVDIVLKKETPQISYSTTAPVATPVAQPVEQTSVKDSVTPVETGTFIKAPMVGTFYKAPSPEADAYVKVGDKVSNNSVVCILEAMKLFNEIEAEVAGEIVEILVEDGEMVEFDQPLFRIK